MLAIGDTVQYWIDKDPLKALGTHIFDGSIGVIVKGPFDHDTWGIWWYANFYGTIMGAREEALEKI